MIRAILTAVALLVAAAEPEEKPADRKALDEIWAEVGGPALRPGKDADKLPPAPEFAADRLKAYAKGGADSDLRKAVRKARAAVWAVAVEAGGGPVDSLTEVQQLRQSAGLGLRVLTEGLRAPANENEFKAMLMSRQREVAKTMGVLMEVHDDLLEAGKKRNRETRRWQANYDFAKARLEMQIAFLFEYQFALGQMRKDIPPRDPATQGGWVLESTPKASGDPTGRKLNRSAQETLDYIIKEHAGTPWEVLARREKDRLIGLEWKAVK